MNGWGVFPEQLGLTVDIDGAMRGLWQGLPVSAQFNTQTHDDGRGFYRASWNSTRTRVDYFTNYRVRLEPSLGAYGVNRNVYFNQLVDPALRGQVEERARSYGVYNVGFSDDAIVGASRRRETALDVYRAVFDLFVWAAKTIQERRTKFPPPWELDIAQAWPSLATGWGMTLDTRRGEMTGVVQGRPTRARVVNRGGRLMTCVEVAAPLPDGCSLSLSRQLEDNIFDNLFNDLVGGGDIEVGDAAFDAAFIVRGQPSKWVKEALTPAARAQLLGLSSAGASITFENGYLTVWSPSVLIAREDIDAFMKAAYAAASALGEKPMPTLPPAPYR